MPMLRPSETLAERKGGTLRLLPAIVLGLILSLKAKCLDLLQPVAQPQQTVCSSSYDPYEGNVPPVDIEIEELLRCSHETINRFLSTHCTVPKTSLLHFFVTYREPTEALQENNWGGPCNNIVELFGEWGARHGHLPPTSHGGRRGCILDRGQQSHPRVDGDAAGEQSSKHSVIIS